eukprot:s7080_g1.t1
MVKSSELGLEYYACKGLDTSARGAAGQALNRAMDKYPQVKHEIYKWLSEGLKKKFRTSWAIERSFEKEIFVDYNKWTKAENFLLVEKLSSSTQEEEWAEIATQCDLSPTYETEAFQAKTRRKFGGRQWCALRVGHGYAEMIITVPGIEVVEDDKDAKASTRKPSKRKLPKEKDIEEAPVPEEAKTTEKEKKPKASTLADLERAKDSRARDDQEPDLPVSWCKLLLTDLSNKPTMKIAREIQSVITEVRQHPELLYFQRIPGVNHWHEMRIITLGDQAHCNRPRRVRAGTFGDGELALMETAKSGDRNPEVQAMVESEDASFRGPSSMEPPSSDSRIFFRAMRVVRRVPRIVGTNSKGGLFDAVTRQEGANLGLSNARAAIQGHKMKESIERAGTRLIWLSGEWNISDALTKKSPECRRTFEQYLRTRVWMLRYDPEFVISAKRARQLRRSAVQTMREGCGSFISVCCQLRSLRDRKVWPAADEAEGPGESQSDAFIGAEADVDDAVSAGNRSEGGDSHDRVVTIRSTLACDCLLLQQSTIQKALDDELMEDDMLPYTAAVRVLSGGEILDAFGFPVGDGSAKNVPDCVEKSEVFRACSRSFVSQVAEIVEDLAFWPGETLYLQYDEDC